MKKPRLIEFEGCGTFVAPPYMARADNDRFNRHGWQARLPGGLIKWFDDGKPRDPIAAYVACRKFLAEQNAPEIAMHVRSRERRDKRESTGVAGISIRRSLAKNGTFSIVILVIHRPLYPKRPKLIYIGTDNNWHGRYEEKLAEAKRIRQAFVEEWERDARRQLGLTEWKEADTSHPA